MSDDIDDVLREWGRAHRVSAAVGAPTVLPINRLVRGADHRRTWAIAAAVVGVAALVIVLSFAIHSPRHDVNAGTASCADRFTAEVLEFDSSPPSYGVTLTYTGDAPCEISAAAPLLRVIDSHRHAFPVGMYRPKAGATSTLTVRTQDILAFGVHGFLSCHLAPDRYTLRVYLDQPAQRAPLRGIAAALGSEGSNGGNCTTPGVVSNLTLVRAMTVRVGIRYVGGPAPGASSAFEPGTIVLDHNGMKKSVTVRFGKRTTIRMPPAGYEITATSGNAECQQQSLAVRSGPTVDVTVLCSVK